MRIRLLLAAALTLALAAALPTASSAATKKRSCSAKGAETVAKNRYVRVYTLAGRRGTDEIARLYACLRKTNRRVRLDTASDDGYVSAQTFDTVRLNGRFVAWQHSEYDGSCKDQCPPGYDQTPVELRVANVRTRKVKRVDGSLGEGDALVVTRRGAIAWIEPGDPVSVRAVDADGRRVLDEGDDIDGGSLRLSGSTVSWIAGGAPMSAVLR